MKPRILSTARLSCLLAAAISAIVSSASAATITWDAGGGGAAVTDGAGAWLGANLWNNATVAATWTSGDDAVFGNAGVGGAVTLASPTIVNSLTLNSFTGTYTLGTAAQTITLNNGITKNTGAGAATIISPITLGAAQSWTNNSAGLLTVGTAAVTNGGFLLTLGGTGHTTVSSIISGAAGLTKSDAGIATLSGANTYGGATTINGGVLAAATLANGGATSNIGNSNNGAANLVFGTPTATLRHTGVTASTDRGFTLSSGAGGGAAIEASGTGTLTLDSTVPIAYGTADETRTLTLGGTQRRDSNFGKALVDNGTGATSLVKNGVGSWALTAVNTYTGGSTVNEGTLVFRTLAAKSGAGTHAFAAGTTLGLGVGGAEFTATDVDNAFSGTMSGNLSNVTVTATTSVGIDTTAGDLAYATDIGSGAKGLSKFGTNTLTLSGINNAYTGATTIAGGTLAVGGLANAGSNSSIGNFATAGATGLTLSGGTLSYTGASTTTDRGFTAIGLAKNTISVGTGVSLTMGASVKGETALSTLDGLAFSSSGEGSSITISSLAITPGTSPDFHIIGSLPAVTIQNLSVSGFNVIAARSGDTNGAMLNVGNIVGTGASGWLAYLNVTGAISGYTGQITLGNNVSLTGLSSFDAPVVIQQGGIYTFNSIKNWGVGASSSALGAPTTLANGTIGFGNGANTPTFKYTGAGDITNRVLNLRGTATLNLEQAGTGHLHFTANTTAAASSKTLNLTGSTAGTGEFSGIIADNSVTNKTSLTKSGTGTWTLTGANTYTGATTVNAGTLALVGGSQKSPVSVTANGTIGFTLGSPPTSTSTVGFLADSKVAVTGTVNNASDYLLMTASGGITGAPSLFPAIPGYFLETRNSGTELWLYYNPNIQTHVINLGAGTTIEGSTFGTYTGPLTGLPLPTLPAGTILRAVNINTVMTATDNGNYASDLTLLVDPTPSTPGGDFNLAFSSSEASATPFGATNKINWPISANAGASTPLVDFKTETAWAAAGNIDLSTNGLFLGNVYGGPTLGGTWSGTITLTYELAGSPYDNWSGGAAANVDTNGDGVENGVAWVVGAPNPTANATALVPTLDNTSHPDFFIYNYRRSDAANADSDTAIKVQYGSDLLAWTEATAGPDIVITPTNDVEPGIDKVEVKIRRTLAVGGRLFARLNVVVTE